MTDGTWFSKTCPDGSITVYRVAPGEPPTPATAPPITIPLAVLEAKPQLIGPNHD